MRYEKDGIIYGVFLHDEPIYVGQTRCGVGERARKHLSGGRSQVAKFIRNLHLGDVEFRELEKAPGVHLDERERFWIAKLGTLTPNGLNQTIGGHSGTLHSAAAKTRMSERMKKVCADPDYLAKITARNRKLWEDPEYRRKQSEGKKLSCADPIYLAKLAERKKAYWDVPERRAAMTEITKAQWADPVQKEEKSKAIRAALGTPEAKEKASQRAKEMWKNEDYRRRVTAARLATLAAKKEQPNAFL